MERSEHDNPASTTPASLARFRNLKLDRKRILLLALLGVLTVALLLALGGGRAAVAALAAADWRLVGVGVLIHYGSFVLRGHRWQLLLRSTGHRLGYLYVMALLLSGWFISALLPARSGDVFRVGALRFPIGDQPTVPVADGLSSIVLERALDMLALLVLGVGFGFLVLQGQLPGWLLTAYAVGLLLLGGVGIALLVAPSLLTWLKERSSKTWWRKTLDFVGQIVAALRALPRQPLLAATVTAESFLIWLSDAVLFWLVLASFGVRWPFGYAAFVALTVDVSVSIPLMPGGVGQAEATYAALLALLSASGFNIAAVVLVTRAVSYWSFLVFSGIVTFAAGFGQLLKSDEPEEANESQADFLAGRPVEGGQ